MLNQLETLQQDTVKKVIEIIGNDLQNCIRVEISLYTSDNLDENRMKELFFDETLKPGDDNDDDVVCYWNDNASVPEGNGGITFYLKW